MLGCVNSPQRPEGARRRDSRNLAFTFSCMYLSLEAGLGLSSSRGEPRVGVRRAALQDPLQLLLVLLPLLRPVAATAVGQQPVHIGGGRRGDGVTDATLARLLSLLMNASLARGGPILLKIFCSSKFTKLHKAY